MKALPCPFCGCKDINISSTTSDERSGYGRTIIVECAKCTGNVVSRSIADRNCWSIEDYGAQTDRTLEIWNTREKF